MPIDRVREHAIFELQVHILTVDGQWEDGQDEQVEVNQRALIDKVLARYAAEFTGAHDPSKKLTLWLTK